jgi:hypothetical protein
MSFCVGGQLALVQHVPLVMHSLPHRSVPEAQEHVPPGAEQTSPVMVQPIAGQQLVVAMQVSLVVQ